jgi:hypothetical protein
MITGNYTHLTARTAKEICSHMRLDAPATQLLADGLSPGHYLDKLLSYALFVDATRFLSHALPPREAVWWGCLCLRLVCEPAQLPPEQAAALQAVVQWVVHPEEKRRREAEAAGKKATLSNAAGCLATGAFYSSGSLNPPELPPAPAKPYLTAKVVNGAVQLSAILRGPGKTREIQQQFMVLGLGVAMGKNRWDSEV